VDEDRPDPEGEVSHTGSPLTRRVFLGHGAAIAGGVTLLAVPGASAAPLRRVVAEAKTATAPYKPVSLSAAQYSTLQSVLEALFPKDSLGPGAVEMGVPTYIDRRLAGSYKPLRATYRSLLPMFERAAKAQGASSFAQLSTAKKQALLKRFEAGNPPGVKAAKTAVAGNFSLLLEHMREGIFGDPMYGGNQGLAGWKLVGYTDVMLVQTAKDQKVGAKVKPSGKTAKSYGGKPYNGTPV